MINGAEIMVNAIKKEGVDVVFGYPGAAICPFFDAAYKTDDFRTILVRHEQNAGHAASGYARSTNKVGVCVATSGPGATNLVTAIATAYLDSVPMVAITGQVNSWLIGRDAFQEADITGSCEPFTKHSYLVKNAEDLPRIMKEAFHIARTGRPGPVLIDVPMDVQLSNVENPKYPETIDIMGYKPSFEGNKFQIKKACDTINNAKRPVILAGGGLFLSDGAVKSLEAIVEKTGIPTICTMMGIGALKGEHRLNLGMVGTHGVAAANIAIAKADTILICGARMGDRTLPNSERINKHTKVIHIDVDPAEIGKNSPYTIPIVGDLGSVLNQISKQVDYKCPEVWSNECISNKKVKAFDQSADKLDPKYFISRLTEKLDSNCIYCADVGQNQIWSANGHKVREGRFLTSGGMGTMGYSVPAAVGAKVANPDKQCIAVCGDGSFQMQFMELATMVQHGIDVKIIVMRNGDLGMVKELQDNIYKGRHIVVDLSGSPDFQILAKAYGIESRRIEKTGQVESAIDALVNSKGSFLLECVVSPEERSL